MATEDEQKKAILPFLQRADEIEAIEPKVAYYCRMCAVDTGIGFGSARSSKIDGVIRALVTKLEKDKPSAQLSANDSEYCRSFAETVFARADRVDRAGRADKGTAMTFYAASIFVEVLRQFGELPQDLVDMQKYAAWKAADINKALREGRQPTPGSSSSPVVAEADLDAQPPEPRSAAEPDFAFPSAPAKDVEAPSFPSSTAQGLAVAPVPGAPPGGGRPPRDASYDLPDVPPSRLESSPSNVSSEAEGLVQAPSASQSAADTDQPRYARGQKVLYDAFDQSVPVRGTVAKVQRSEGKWQYTVALPDRIVSVFEHILAPDFEPGDSVMYQSPDGTNMPATVVQTDASHWRPTYVIRTHPDQAERNTLDDRLLKFAPASARSQKHTDGAGSARPAGLASPSASAVTSPPPAAAPPRPAASWASRPPGPAQTGSHSPSQPLQSTNPPQLSTTRERMHSPMGVAPAVVTPVAGFEPSLTAVSQAQKYARQAASALGFEDVQTAVQNLTDALRLLTAP